jgi:hypothetical protein
MLTPLHWVWNAPLALGWVVGSAIVFPVLRKLGLAPAPNTLDFTNDMRGKTIIVTGKPSTPLPFFVPKRDVCARQRVEWED